MPNQDIRDLWYRARVKIDGRRVTITQPFFPGPMGFLLGFAYGLLIVFVMHKVAPHYLPEWFLAPEQKRLSGGGELLCFMILASPVMALRTRLAVDLVTGKVTRSDWFLFWRKRAEASLTDFQALAVCPEMTLGQKDKLTSRYAIDFVGDVGRFRLALLATYDKAQTIGVRVAEATGLPLTAPFLRTRTHSSVLPQATVRVAGAPFLLPALPADSRITIAPALSEVTLELPRPTRDREATLLFTAGALVLLLLGAVSVYLHREVRPEEMGTDLPAYVATGLLVVGVIGFIQFAWRANRLRGTREAIVLTEDRVRVEKITFWAKSKKKEFAWSEILFVGPPPPMVWDRNSGAVCIAYEKTGTLVGRCLRESEQQWIIDALAVGAALAAERDGWNEVPQD